MYIFNSNIHIEFPIMFQMSKELGTTPIAYFNLVRGIHKLRWQDFENF